MTLTKTCDRCWLVLNESKGLVQTSKQVLIWIVLELLSHFHWTIIMRGETIFKFRSWSFLFCSYIILNSTKYFYNCTLSTTRKIFIKIFCKEYWALILSFWNFRMSNLRKLFSEVWATYNFKSFLLFCSRFGWSTIFIDDCKRSFGSNRTLTRQMYFSWLLYFKI